MPERYWRMQVLRLCDMAMIVAYNEDVTREEMQELAKLADEVKDVMIREINALTTTEGQ